MNSASKIRRLLAVFATAACVCTGVQAADTQSLQSIRTAAEAHVRGLVPSDSNVVVTAGALDPRLRLAPCPVPLQAALVAGTHVQPRMSVGVSCERGSRWTVYVPVTVESHISILVLRRAAARGARLSAADVERQERVVTGTAAAYLTDISELAGRTLKRPLAAGAALTIDAMADAIVVKRGQQVTLLASLGGLEVRAEGVAMSDAPAEGRVKVQNMSSRRIVEGVVESADVIRITP
jgi:flagellar basal body P-ring formation protein FlgA